MKRNFFVGAAIPATGKAFVAGLFFVLLLGLLSACSSSDSDPDNDNPPAANSAPVANAGVAQTVTSGATVQLDGSGSRDPDGDSLTFSWSLTSLPGGSGAVLSDASSVTSSFVADLPGTYVAQLIVNDGRIDSPPSTVTIEVTSAMVSVPDVVGQPQVAAEAAITGAGLSVGEVTRQSSDPVPVDTVISQDPASGSSVATGAAIALAVSSGPATTGSLPPDPADVAPPLDPGQVSSLQQTTAFLYSGANPIQTGVAPDTIELKRAAVLRGRVLDRDDAPLSGVTISIKNHPEFGQTLSRADGMFDMAVNGGGLLTVDYQKAGYLPVQRQIDAPWNDFANSEDVVMIPLDEQVTTIDLSDTSQAFQVARGKPVTDVDGTRQATLLFPQGTPPP